MEHKLKTLKKNGQHLTFHQLERMELFVLFLIEEVGYIKKVSRNKLIGTSFKTSKRSDSLLSGQLISLRK